MSHAIKVVLIIVCAFGLLNAGIIRVPADVSTIQGGIDLAAEGDTVLVANGTYYENINFKGKAITVASHFLVDGDTTHIDNAIINGSQPSHPNSGSVVVFVAGEDSTSVLCGFTITGGTGTLVTSLNDYRGGGIFTWFSGCKIIHNKISNNFIEKNANINGVGISISCRDGLNAVIRQNKIFNNQGSNSGGYISGGGLAIDFNGQVNVLKNKIYSNSISGPDNIVGSGILVFFGDSGPNISVRIDGNIISNNYLYKTTNNTINAGGAGIRIRYDGRCSIIGNIIENNYIASKYVNAAGGGISLYDLAPEKVIIENNTISGNRITDPDDENLVGFGGAIYTNAPVKIINNCILKNSSGTGAGIYYSNATSAPAHLIKNLIYQNQAKNNGGGAYLGNAKNLTCINNSIVNNSANRGGGIFFNSSYSPHIENTIIYNNVSHDVGNQVYLSGVNSDPHFYYCDIEGDSSSFAGNGAGSKYTGDFLNNINVDPLFSDLLCHLGEGSPCIDAGNPSPLCNDLDGSRNDMGAYGGVYDSLFIFVGIEDPKLLSKNHPETFLLYQNFPNPFNPTTTISYKLLAFSRVDLSIYNLLGQKVATLVSAKQPAGKYEVQWDATGFASGVYLYKLDTDNGFSQTRKLVLLR